MFSLIYYFFLNFINTIWKKYIWSVVVQPIFWQPLNKHVMNAGKTWIFMLEPGLEMISQQWREGWLSMQSCSCRLVTREICFDQSLMQLVLNYWLFVIFKQTQVERVLWGTCKNMQELAWANIKTAAFLLWKCLLSFKCLLKFLLNFLLSVLPIVPCNFYCECKLDFVKHSAIRPHSVVQWQLQISCKMKTIRVGVILQTQTTGQYVGNMYNLQSSSICGFHFYFNPKNWGDILPKCKIYKIFSWDLFLEAAENF